MTAPRILLSGVSAPLREQLLGALAGTGATLHNAEAGQLQQAVEDVAPVLLLLGPQFPAMDLQRTVSGAREVALDTMMVLALLSTGDEHGLEHAARAAVDDFVVPPHPVPEVAARVHAMLERAQTLSESQQRKRDGAALLELSQTLGSSLDVNLVLHSASRLMAQVMDVERCAIVMVDVPRNEGVVVAVSEDRNIREIRVSLLKYPEIQRVVETGAPLVVSDTAQDPLLKDVRAQQVALSGTALLFPILIDERVSGVFFLRSRRVRSQPGEREMQFGQTVASATGAAIRNARLYEGQRESTQRVTQERERAEERIQDLQKYEAFFEEAADGMVILDKDGSIVYVNREGARQFEVSREALSGRRFFDLLSPDSGEELRTVLQDVMRGRYRRGFDLYAPRVDGDEACLSCSAGAVGSAGRARLCMLSFRDVTEMREIQTELKTTKDFLENLIDSSVDAIIAADISGNVILFNTGAEAIYGYRADEVIGRVPVARLYPKGVAEEIMRLLRSDDHGPRGKLKALRRMVLSKTGEEVPVELTASIIYENGDEVATVGIFTDLRERLKIEKQLSRVQERLLETEKAAVAAQLAGAAAHELNQPLTSVLGYSEMLRRKIPEDSPLRRSVDIIFKEGERMADIVRKIGRITKWETKTYGGNTLIVDLEKSSEVQPLPSGVPHAPGPAIPTVPPPPKPQGNP